MSAPASSGAASAARRPRAERGKPRRNVALLAQAGATEATAGGAAAAAATASPPRQLAASAAAAAAAAAQVVDLTADDEDVAEPAAKKVRLSEVAAPVHGVSAVADGR